MTAETDSSHHSQYMAKALALAEQAAAQEEVPIGAVLVRDGEIIGCGFNQPISSCDPSAHAEIVALREAASRCGNYRLPGSTLYVTIEPCTMCVGAMIHARVERLVFGAREPRAGAVVSQQDLEQQDFFNHRIVVVEGVMAEPCAELMETFFAARR